VKEIALPAAILSEPSSESPVIIPVPLPEMIAVFDV
jgi:hypothetical protein